MTKGPYQPRHLVPPTPYPAPRGHLAGLARSQYVDFWRDLQDRLGSRALPKKTTRDPDLHPKEQP